MPYKDKKKLYEFQIKRWINLKLKAIQYKGGKCLDCGFSGHYAVFEFHHRDPSVKEYAWNKLRKRPLKTILEELDKCDVLCANCHRLRHVEDRLNKKTL